MVSCNINSPVLPSIIDNGLIFLAKGVERYPPLELDTLHGFLSRNLCTEIWQNAGEKFDCVKLKFQTSYYSELLQVEPRLQLLHEGPQFGDYLV